jgi:two-component system OmpR family response regulator
MEILAIEDDPVIGKAVQQGLSEAGHHCTWVKDSRHGYEQALSQRFEVVILDLMIPGEPGMVLLEKLRKQGVKTPVLIVTALGAVDDRVKGLQGGADDYIVKPFALPELLARIDAVCRRVSTKPAAVLRAGDLTLDLTTRRVTRGTAEIELMRHVGQVVTRKMLCESLWESDWEGTTNVIEVHINRLRGKVQRGSREPLIHTVRGRGYVLRTP